MSAVSHTDHLRYRLRATQRRVDRARAEIAEALHVIPHPYLAFSGGKDSLVTLALVREQRPHIPVIWSDDELEYPEQPAYVAGLAALWGLNLTVTLGHARHGGWFDPWQQEPYWREPLPGALRVNENLETWAPRQGYGGTILGLRRQESAKRRTYMRARGTLHDTVATGWRCNPIADWSVDDVWALIAGWDLPYNPVYDRLAAAGVPRPQQRVGPLPLTPGWILQAAYPQLLHDLVARYGPHW